MPRKREGAGRILDWETLEKAPNTHGAFSFLKSAAEVVSIRGTAIETVKVNRRPYKVRACTRVQHGQTDGETTLLKALWEAGEKQQDDTRVKTIGWKTMAALVCKSDKTVIRNMKGLISKLAVVKIADEIMKTRTGRTYRIYSFAQILERRKAVGMVWYISDKGARFVNQDGSPLQMPSQVLAIREEQNSSIKTSTVDITSTGAMDKATTGAMDVTSTETVDRLSTPLRSSLRKQQEVKTSSSERSQMMQALAEYGRPDNQAVEQLWRTCREICPDAVVEEVVALIHDKGLHILRNRGITSPIGFLLTSVPKCFHGESITELRRLRAREREAATARREEELRREREYLAMLRADYEKYTAITLDPSASPDKVGSAKTMLASIVPELERCDTELR